MATDVLRSTPVTARGLQVAADYVSLTKPRIIELLRITTVPAMLVAAGGWPGGTLLVATLIGGATVSGSAHATNMVIDRDIDGAVRAGDVTAIMQGMRADRRDQDEVKVRLDDRAACGQ